MEQYINVIKAEIGSYKLLINSTTLKDGYGLERRSANVWDILENWLKGYIDEKLYNNLYDSWCKVVKQVYKNKSLCIC